MRIVPTALALFALLAPAAGQELENASFEKKGSPPPGWSVEIGATNGDGAESRMTVKTGDAKKGRSALKLAGDSSTAKWRMVYQDLPVEPTQRVTLTAAMQAKKIAREGRQFHNAYAALSFYDGEEHIETLFGPMLTGDREWVDLTVQGIAPEKATKLRVKFFLSMSGTLWVDDVRVQVAPTEPFDKAARESAFDAIALHLTQGYPFWGVDGKPEKPAKFFKSHRGKAVKAKGQEKFLEAVEKMLNELNDLHVSMSTPNGKIYTGPNNPYTTNWNWKAVEGHFAKTLVKEESFLVALLKEGPGYVRIGSFGLPEDAWPRLDAAMDRLSDAPSLIIDVRPNGGGDEGKAKFIASRFAAEKIEFARSRYRDKTRPDEIAFGDPVPRYVGPREGREPDTRPVAVLQGRFCVSSTEAFLFMMKAIPTATTVGLPSRGGSGNPRGFRVVPGVTHNASTRQALTLDDECNEGVGVEPQITVDERISKYLKGDPTFERALEVLAASPGR